jgi:hypothetical protein
MPVREYHCIIAGKLPNITPKDNIGYRISHSIKRISYVIHITAKIKYFQLELILDGIINKKNVNKKNSNIAIETKIMIFVLQKGIV